MINFLSLCLISILLSKFFFHRFAFLWGFLLSFGFYSLYWSAIATVSKRFLSLFTGRCFFFGLGEGEDLKISDSCEVGDDGKFLGAKMDQRQKWRVWAMSFSVPLSSEPSKRDGNFFFLDAGQINKSRCLCEWKRGPTIHTEGRTWLVRKM